MYNRYMRNDDGTYIRVPEEEPSRRSGQSQPPPGGGQDHRDEREHSHGHDSQGHGSPDGPEHPPGQDHNSRDPDTQEHSHGSSGHWEPPPAGDGSWFDPSSPPPGGRKDGLTGFLRHFLDQWHLDSVDTGDLLLLGLLFFLFREDADEELLVALGLLLIL